MAGLRTGAAFACALLLAAAGHSEGRGLDVQGHRGARALRPENTLPAFARALELGVSTLELDLGLSRDGRLVVTHNPRVSHELCLDAKGKPLPDPGPRVRDLSLAELRGFDCGLLPADPERFPSPPHEPQPGTPMPTLGEVFELAKERGASGVHFNVEVKVDPHSEDTPAVLSIVRTAIEVVQRHGVLARTTLQSFDWSALRMAREIEPRLRTAALLAPDTVGPEWQSGLTLEEHGDALGLLRAARSYVDDFSPWWKLLVPGRAYAGRPVEAYQQAGFAVIPWTVNEPETMARLIDLGIDGLITDRPDLLMGLAKKLGLRVAPALSRARATR